MVKVVGPLFSLSASGTYRESLVFRTRAGETYVASLPSELPARTPSQIAHNQNLADMAASWTSQSVATKAAWAVCGVPTSETGYAIWWQQWIIQGSSTGSPPVKPC